MEEIAPRLVDDHRRECGAQSNPAAWQFADASKFIRITATVETEEVCHLLHTAAVGKKNELVCLAEKETCPVGARGEFSIFEVS
jgi:hypothetical protein